MKKFLGDYSWEVLFLTIIGILLILWSYNAFEESKEVRLVPVIEESHDPSNAPR